MRKGVSETSLYLQDMHRNCTHLCWALCRITRASIVAFPLRGIRIQRLADSFCEWTLAIWALSGAAPKQIARSREHLSISCQTTFLDRRDLVRVWAEIVNRLGLFEVEFHVRVDKSFELLLLVLGEYWLVLEREK